MTTRRSRPTLQAVADASGYSPSTVSRALREDPRVATRTRDRIARVARELGFTQNALASTLRTGGTSATVAMLIPDLVDPFFGRVAAAVQTAADRHGLEVMIGCHRNSTKHQERLVHQMTSHRVRALIIVPAPGPVPEQLATETRFGTTVVSIDRPAPHLGCDSLTTDNEGGARALTTALLDAGHDRFAVVGLDETIWTQEIRLRTVVETLAAAGVEFDPRAVATADETGLIPESELEDMLVTHRPTAVIGLSVMPLVQVIDAAHRLGIEVDLASFDGHPLFHLLDARIYCVEQSASALGEAAVEFLLRERGESTPPQQLVLPVGPLMIRGRRSW